MFCRLLLISYRDYPFPPISPTPYYIHTPQQMTDNSLELNLVECHKKITQKPVNNENLNSLLVPSVCGQAGTTGYMAPEVLKQEYYRYSVDWWSLGCSIYEMVAARLPFRDFREKVQNDEVTRRTLEDECKFEHKSFDAPTKDIISRFLKKRVARRFGCQ